MSARAYIPGMRSWGIRPGNRMRFVNPRVDGGAHLLEAVTGGGWVLLARQAMALSAGAAAVLDTLACRRVQIGRDVDDTDGHLTTWFDRAGAQAVWLRPDFYVAAIAHDAPGLSDAIERIGTAMELSTSSTADAGRR